MHLESCRHLMFKTWPHETQPEDKIFKPRTKKVTTQMKEEA